MEPPKKSFVVITGASSGIGAAAAHLFSKKGYGTILVGRNPERLKKVRAGLPAPSLIVRGDLREPAIGPRILQTLDHQPLVGLINNAGIFNRLSFEQSDEKLWRETFEQNFLSTVSLTKHLLPALRASGRGSIVNVASTVGERPVAGMSAYAAAKAAMINWTKSSALELAPRVRVNCVSPGIIDTPIHSFRDEDRKALAAAQPLGRVGRAPEIAAGIFFLFAHPWTTGVILPIDGGISLT